MKMTSAAFVIPFMLAAGGCATMSNVTPAPTATATLIGADGRTQGTATVTQAADGLRVLVKASGLTPGVHGVHIHTTGKCDMPDFKTAGGHWNPTAHQHGRDNPAGAHMGDMPNMIVSSSGKGAIEYAIPGGMLTGGDMPLLDADGAAIVVHATADDYKSDPAGNAGARVECGVLKGH